MNRKYITMEGILGDEIYIEDSKTKKYTAFFKDFPKMTTEGDTVEEAQNNLWKMLYDVLQNYFKQKEFNINDTKS